MENDNSTRKNIIDNNEFLVKKKFSQNFLLDKNIIFKIIESANLDKDTFVIEVGPGLGALTKEIVKIAKKLIVYEVDSELIPYLNKFFSEYDNFVLLNKDILKANVNEDIKNHFFEPQKIVLISNLPYHITTPIIMKFLEEVEDIDTMVLMMQLEVAQRISSAPNTKDYNALSVIIQHQAKVKYLFKVSKSVFHPKPNVDSAVIKLDIIKNNVGNRNKEFYDFLHKCFSQRRKTLINNLANGYNKYGKEELTNILNENNLNPLVRAEALSLNDFMNLYEKYFK